MKIASVVIVLSLILMVTLPTSAQTFGRCKPNELIELINAIGSSPIGDALNLYTSTTASIGNYAETYNDLMNYRVGLEDEWKNIRECDAAYIEMYTALMRITVGMQDVMALSILFESGIATEVDTAQQTLLERMSDDTDLLSTLLATQEE